MDPLPKSFLPLLGGIVCPLLSWLVYRLARRRLKNKDPLKSRAMEYYRILSGVLLGQFLFHTATASAAVPQTLWFTLIFILVGFNLMAVADAIGRVWNTNSNFVAPALLQEDTEDIGLDRDKMELQTVVVATNVSSNGFSRTLHQTEDHAKDTRKRQWLLGVLLLSFSVLAFKDGLMLIDRVDSPVPALVVCYYLNGICMTVAVYGAMIHAYFHVTEEKKPRLIWWIAVSGLWCVVLTCSSIFVLVDMPWAVVDQVVRHKAFVAFYGLFGGCILYLTVYFFMRGGMASAPNKKSVLWGVFIHVVSTAPAVLTGYYL